MNNREFSGSLSSNAEHGTEIVLVSQVRRLTDSVVVISIKSDRKKFSPGQHIICSSLEEHQAREYSIYSGIDDEDLSILVKAVEGGHFSPKLVNIRPGDNLRISGPHGHFAIRSPADENKKHLFISTGTGIAPFHSMILSYPSINYKLVHGVRFGSEAYDAAIYDKDRYILCTSRDSVGHYNGRVNHYLESIDINDWDYFYLCGNGEMVYNVKKYLRQAGVDVNNIFNEVYF